jgi:endonuclease G
MQIGTVTTRNYSFYWDYSNLVAQWVAYPLCNWNIGSSTGRTDNWGLDPLLPSDKQPVLFKGFSSGNNGWYARGHQCPSADRLTSREANAMTFYFTNMTPQIQDNFNGGIWAGLESQVRTWAKNSDTLYVVTGCVTEGSTYYALDNNGKKVTVPTGYYKAVLRYSKSTTLGFSGYMACAVYLDHKEYSAGTVSSSYSMSIDDLEKKLGLDLFVNLPDAIGQANADKVEAQEPSTVSWWW